MIGFRAKTIVFEDRFGREDWSSVAQQLVNALAAVLPAGAPAFLYRLGNGACFPPTESIPAPDGVVVMCPMHGDPFGAGHSGYGSNVTNADGTEIISGNLWIADDTNDGDFPTMLCHEMIHTLFDSPGVDEHTLTIHPGCFGYDQPTFGEGDQVLLVAAYGAAEEHPSPPKARPRKHRKHHH